MKTVFRNRKKFYYALYQDKVEIVDEDQLRQILMVRKDALEGLKVEGLDVNAMLSSVLQDYSYVLCGNSDNNSDNTDRILLKIPMEVEVKTRYSSNQTKARIVQIDKNTIKVEFEEDVRALTPGQSAVFYIGDYILGGGKIDLA